MGVIRQVSEVLTAVVTVEGAGVHLRRAFGAEQGAGTDPFLQLDDLRSNSPADYLPGYPWHPHRGLETITYPLAGSVTYSDSLGNRGVTPAGEVQWMTAGSGVVHQEMPRGDRAGRLAGVQLWTNLPARLKMRPPRYIEIVSEEIPAVELPGGGSLLVISGQFGKARGPVPDLMTTPTFFDVTLLAGEALSLPVTDGFTILVYALSGDLLPAPGHAPVSAHQTVIYERQGDTLALAAGEDGAHILVIGGGPLGEPVVRHGPIVMNTAEELDTALRELQEGTFIKDFAAVTRDAGMD
ncbi:MAG: pirin family protein [Anaerolineae bacterium]